MTDIDLPPLSFAPDADLANAFVQAAQAAAELPPRCGTVYLLHFDRPYGHAAHYTGWTRDLDARLDQHATGRGARLMTVIHQAGIGWTLARIWPGSTRNRERALKRQGGASRRCPICLNQNRGGN